MRPSTGILKTVAIPNALFYQLNMVLWSTCDKYSGQQRLNLKRLQVGKTEIDDEQLL